ncbi:histidinol dehydrogenase [Sphingosinicella microcystinivorans]|uniref:Histidinol dehydrogenase n=1 Tax=Sphingosinicella microcystinivorans TaxID=335406 RepID=A0AAD1FZZ0_SPHMI|nr:histidinol dehydrogenase [Sphingosinicella microcystinivorans]RKS85457.1 histidinol dehydrogenase [Sphingosinicella microcystinivorans]BBE33253.1 histidinol dehydrogenase [Sphingosinicella microcystinivorans]
MPLELSSADADFAARFATFVEAGRETATDVSAAVSGIIADVRQRGDAALFELTRRFDRTDVTTLRFTEAEISAAKDQIEPDLRAALELAAERVRAFHVGQLPADHDAVDAAGVRAGWRWSAIDDVGIYVPGGLASYPSTVLMNAIPAKVAGVRRLVMTTPTPGGEVNPLVLYAASLAGVDEIYRVGGAQAIAALTFGTDTIRRVDKITGPGNAYVAEAKRQLFGRVGIDMVAGPSEILVVADSAANPDWLAADLLSQAEHDRVAQAILITDNADLAARTAKAVNAALDELDADVARESWARFGAIITVGSLDEAPALIDALAPEHLALSIADPQAMFARVRHAGSVFMGYRTPEAIGDYLGGPNHTLPTGRRARFSSGLSVADFMKRTTFLDCSAEAFAAIGPAAARLAKAEGLPAHALSVTRRLG